MNCFELGQVLQKRCFWITFGAVSKHLRKMSALLVVIICCLHIMQGLSHKIKSQTGLNFCSNARELSSHTFLTEVMACSCRWNQRPNGNAESPTVRTGFQEFDKNLCNLHKTAHNLVMNHWCYCHRELWLYVMTHKFSFISDWDWEWDW